MEEVQPGGKPESYPALFWRFLRFGLLAWGGPIPQIAMIRQELGEEDGWISKKRFNRVLGLYQALPGPEAHELCVDFGTIAKGRFGGFLAGLGFMLPGFVLMFGLSWFYLAYGMAMPHFTAAFHGLQAAVGALILRALHRIGGHSLKMPFLSGSKRRITTCASSVRACLMLLVLPIWSFQPARAEPPMHGGTPGLKRDPTNGSSD
jgi:chromate transporter